MTRILRELGFIVVLGLGFSGCSQILTRVETIARNDFARTVELAEKYGKPDVKQCFVFLASALDSVDSDQMKLDELLKEDTAGLASSALKAVLIKEALESLNDPGKQKQFENSFNENCCKLSGKILLNLFRDARNVSKRLPGS